MSDIEIITFGCRLNAYELEVMRKHASDAGLGATVIVNTCAVTQESVRQARQAIRQGAPRESARQDRGHRLRRANRSGPLRRHGRGGSRHRQWREDRSADLQGSRLRRYRADQGQRHHVGEGDGGPSDRWLRRPSPRLCADPERLRPPLHLLHHSLWARAVAVGAGGRGGGAGAEAGRERLCRDRADRRRHHGLWRGPSRRAHARQAGDQNFEARA